MAAVIDQLDHLRATKLVASTWYRYTPLSAETLALAQMHIQEVGSGDQTSVDPLALAQAHSQGAGSGNYPGQLEAVIPPTAVKSSCATTPKAGC